MIRIPSNKILRCSTGLKVAGLLVAIFFSRPTNQLCAEPVLDKALTDLNSADTVFNTQIVEASEEIADELQSLVNDLAKQARLDDAVAARNALKFFEEQAKLPEDELFLPIREKAIGLIESAIATLQAKYSEKIKEFTVAGELDAALEIRDRWAMTEIAIAKSNDDGLGAIRFVQNIKTVSLDSQKKILESKAKRSNKPASLLIMGGSAGVEELKISKPLWAGDLTRIQYVNQSRFKKLGIFHFVKMEGGINKNFMQKYLANNQQMPNIDFKVQTSGWIYIALSQHVEDLALKNLLASGWVPLESDWEKTSGWIRYMHPEMKRLQGFGIFKKWLPEETVGALPRITPSSPILLLP